MSLTFIEGGPYVWMETYSYVELHGILVAYHYQPKLVNYKQTSTCWILGFVLCSWALCQNLYNLVSS